MQADSSITYMKRNAKVLTFLAVEECEAHLHPAMQYKFLQFLQDNKANGHVRQIFMTTHSTQIASAVKLDDLICLTSPILGKINVGYPRVIYKKIMLKMWHPSNMCRDFWMQPRRICSLPTD